MSKNYMLLSLLPVGESCKLVSLNSKGLIRRRLLDLGLIRNTIISPLYKSPFGDPIAYLIRGTVIALRNEIASNIIVEKL